MKKENRETLASSSLILTWAIMLTGSVTWAASPGHHEEGHHGGGHGHEFHEVLLTADTAYLQEQNTWQVSVISDYRMDKAIEHGSEDEWELILEAEYGITDWLQLLLEVPYIKVEEKEDNHADHEDQGPGDVIVGLDFLLHEEEGSDWFNPTVAVGAALSLPTGDAPDDPGHDTVGWEVQIVASNTIDEFSLHFGAGFGKFSDAMPLGEEHEVDIIEYELSAAGAWECATGLELILELSLSSKRKNMMVTRAMKMSSKSYPVHSGRRMNLPRSGSVSPSA